MGRERTAWAAVHSTWPAVHRGKERDQWIMEEMEVLERELGKVVNMEVVGGRKTRRVAVVARRKSAGIAGGELLTEIQSGPDLGQWRSDAKAKVGGIEMDLGEEVY